MMATPAAAYTGRCSDCGAPAIGTFAVLGHTGGKDKNDPGSDYVHERARPLCATCSTRRPGTVPTPTE